MGEFLTYKNAHAAANVPLANNIRTPAAIFAKEARRMGAKEVPSYAVIKDAVRGDNHRTTNLKTPQSIETDRVSSLSWLDKKNDSHAGGIGAVIRKAATVGVFTLAIFGNQGNLNATTLDTKIILNESGFSPNQKVRLVEVQPINKNYYNKMTFGPSLSAYMVISSCIRPRISAIIVPRSILL